MQAGARPPLRHAKRAKAGPRSVTSDFPLASDLRFFLLSTLDFLLLEMLSTFQSPRPFVSRFGNKN